MCRLVEQKTIIPITSTEQSEKKEKHNGNMAEKPAFAVCVPSHGKWVSAGPEVKGSKKLSIVAVDCEMCLTSEGLELTRVSLVGKDLKTVYDSFVLPYNDIVNYNTKFSGITKEILDSASKRLEDVQREILELISDRTILAGHSLENDLIALKMVHTRIIDTSVLYPSSRPGYKNALRWLCNKYLNRTIQTKTHNSVEDSLAVMELIKHKLSNPDAGSLEKAEAQNLCNVLFSQHKRSMIIADAKFIAKYASLALDCVPVESDEKCTHHTAQTAKREKDQNSPHFVVSRLTGFQDFLQEFYQTEISNSVPDKASVASVLQTLDENLQSIYANLVPNSLLIVATTSEEKTAQTNDHNVDVAETSRLGISFFTIK